MHLSIQLPPTPAAAMGSPSGSAAGAPAVAFSAVAPLSSVQTSPQKQQAVKRKLPMVTWAKGGNYCKLKLFGGSKGKINERQAITEFSDKSRRALLELVNSINQDVTQPGDWAFVTLTYARDFPSARATKRDLDALLKRFERQFGQHFGIWKLEPQTRGAPHFHLLLNLGAGFNLVNVTSWVAHAWHEIAGQGDPNHLRWHLGQCRNQTVACVEVVSDWKQLANYTAKYLGKVCKGDEEWKHPGRYWGKIRRSLAPITILNLTLSEEMAHKIKRQMVKSYQKNRSGFYFISGKCSAPGKHQRGYSVHGSKIAPGGEIKRLTPEFLAKLGAELGRKVRPQFRRWRGSGGAGCSLFMSEKSIVSLVEWAENQTLNYARVRKLKNRRLIKGRRSSATVRVGRPRRKGAGTPALLLQPSRVRLQHVLMRPQT